jgi:hypothetical protein
MGDKTWLHWKEYTTVGAGFHGKYFEVSPVRLTLSVLAASVFTLGYMKVTSGRWAWEWAEYGTDLTISKEFREESRKIGMVAQRVNGSPVFLNPFSHRIPGSILGPEDVEGP